MEMTLTSQYLDPSETKRPQPLVAQVHDYITEMRPVRWIHTDELCKTFFNGEYTESLDTVMRSVVKIIKTSHSFHTIVITGLKGFKACESWAEFWKYRSTEIKRFQSALETVKALDYQADHNDFYELQIGKYDDPLFSAFVDTKRLESEQRKAVVRKAEPIPYDETVLDIPDIGKQVSMAI